MARFFPFCGRMPDDCIASQLKTETVVDKAALDGGAFVSAGGFARLNKVFEGRLESLLGELAEEVWSDSA